METWHRLPSRTPQASAVFSFSAEAHAKVKTCKGPVSSPRTNKDWSVILKRCPCLSKKGRRSQILVKKCTCSDTGYTGISWCALLRFPSRPCVAFPLPGPDVRNVMVVGSLSPPLAAIAFGQPPVASVALNRHSLYGQVYIDIGAFRPDKDGQPPQHEP